MGKTVRMLVWSVLYLFLSVPLFAQTQQPSAEESALFAKAQASTLDSDYQAYLDQYPKGVFAEIALFEMKWGVKDPDAEPVAAVAPEVKPEPRPPEAPARGAQTDVTFEGPLQAPGTPVDGKSIAQLIEGTPLFPPIDGIPENLWKDKTCSNCHNWTKEALCTQGATYATDKGESALAKKHPYGGALKAALKTFALGGCR
ncbi:MAG: hypothetical protein WBA92_03075 [Pseudorhodobacter sp.]